MFTWLLIIALFAKRMDWDGFAFDFRLIDLLFFSILQFNIMYIPRARSDPGAPRRDRIWKQRLPGSRLEHMYNQFLNFTALDINVLGRRALVPRIFLMCKPEVLE